MDIRLVWTHTPVTDRKEFLVYTQVTKIEVTDYKQALKEQTEDLKTHFAKSTKVQFCDHFPTKDPCEATTHVTLSDIYYKGIVPVVNIRVEKQCAHAYTPRYFEYGFTPSTRWAPYDPAMKDVWANCIDREVAREYTQQLEARIVDLEKQVSVQK